MICFDFCIGRYGTDENEIEAESELVHASDTTFPQPLGEREALSYCCQLCWQRCESAFALLSHKKVTKRLTSSAIYGII